MIRSINYSQIEIIQHILKLHCKTDQIDIDPTYGHGMFYNSTGIKKPLYCSDTIPLYDFVWKQNAEHLPFHANTMDTIIFDPPFLATTGKSLKSKDHNTCTIAKRYGVYPNEKKLFEFYDAALAEFYRLLQIDGILIFKCQDKVSSGKQYFSHINIYNTASKLGYYPKDLFVLLAKNRVVANWQRKNQKHARKFHSYFWVLKKLKKRGSDVSSN